MTITNIFQRLWPGLARILRAIGRWLLPKIKRLGTMIVGYMRGKVDDFKRRRDKARSERRKRWLTGRIRRWTNAANWLEGNVEGWGRRAHLVAHNCGNYSEMAKTIPLVAAAERDPSRRAA